MKITIPKLAETVMAIIKDKVNSKIEEIGDEIFELTLQRTPVRTGYLKSRWEKHTKEKDGWKEMTIQNDAPYAEFVENGTDKQAPKLMLQSSVNDAVIKHENDKL